MDPDERLRFTLLELLIAVSLLILLIYFVTKSSNDTLFRQKSMAIDLALTHDTILASPYNVELNYSNVNKDLEVSFSSELCKVFVNKKGTPKESTSEFICAFNKYLESTYNIKNNQLIQFSKEDNFEVK